MIYDKADEVIKKRFESLLNRYQIELETSMRGSHFIFDRINLLHCKHHKINLKLEGSYKDFTDWIENRKTKINPINNNNKYFQ